MTRHTPLPVELRWSRALRCYFAKCSVCGRTVRESKTWRHLTPKEYAERGE